MVQECLFDVAALLGCPPRGHSIYVCVIDNLGSGYHQTSYGTTSFETIGLACVYA